MTLLVSEVTTTERVQRSIQFLRKRKETDEQEDNRTSLLIKMNSAITKAFDV